MATFYASKKRGYVAIKQEATPGVAVTPTHFSYLYDESVATPFESEVVDVDAGLRTENYFMIAGKNGAPTGKISLPIQAGNIGYWLASAMGNPSVSSVSDSAYTASFTSGATGNIPTCSIEIGNKDAAYARRYCGVVIGNTTINQKGNAWSADFNIMARYAFVQAHIVGAMSASATTAELDTNHGLVAGDVIKLGFQTANQEDATLLTVNANGTTVTFAATSNSHADSDLVALKQATVSYSTATPQFQWMGGTTTKYGASIGAAAALSRFHDFTVTLNQKLEPEYAPNGTTDFSRYPIDILVDSYSSTSAFNVNHKDLVFQEAMRLRSDVALDVISTGNLIGTSSRDTFEVQVPKLRIDPSTPSLAGSGISTETIGGRNQYSASDGFDLKFIVVSALSSFSS